MHNELLDERNNATSTCALCETSLSHFPIIESGLIFCCSGCQTVYSILSSKQQLENYQESLVFQQALQAGLISNPALLDQIRQRQLNLAHEVTEKLHLEIGDMWCPSCAEVIRLMLLQQKGIVNCVVDYATDLAAIEFAPKHISIQKIHEIICSLGYKPLSLDDPIRKKVGLDLYLRFGVAAFFSLNAMMFAYPLYATYYDTQAESDGRIFAWLTFFCSLPVMTYCMAPIFKRFISALKVALFGMEALVVMGVFSAFGLSLYQLLIGSNEVYFDSMTVIVTFVLLGKIFETKAKFSAKESLFKLTRSIPKRARKLFPDGSTKFVSIKDIHIDDLIVAHAGEKLIMDGEIIEGEGKVDESMMTGESIPLEKSQGSKVLSGTLLKHGSFTYKVTSRLEETTLNQIIQTVEQDIAHKSTYVRAADKIVSWFVPLVFVIAFLTWFLSWLLGSDAATLKAVSVLLIACPCAIGIAAPLAESYLMHQLSCLGILIRNRGCLEIIPKITTCVFDKTGTITEGSFKVIQGLESMPQNHQTILKALSKSSNHLISKSIFDTIHEPSQILENTIEYTGRGIVAHFADKLCLLGSKNLFQEQNIFVQDDVPSELQGITTYVFFSPDGGERVYKIFLGDNLKKEIPNLITSIEAKVALLSGDSFLAVQSAALAAGIQNFFFGHNPLQKREFIESLRKKGEIICMVGDGINDAPALTAAHIGISVFSASDVSIQVSDILLTSDRLDVLPKMIQLAKNGQKIIKQNLFWAFFYNIIGIGLAIFGILSPIFAAFAMTASSLIILLNSTRASSPGPGQRVETLCKPNP